MSVYQVQQCVFDHLRRLEQTPGPDRPPISVDGYDLTPAERDALLTPDIGALHAMGTHPVLINGLCRALGYRRADYRVLFTAPDSRSTPSATPSTARRPRWLSS